MNAEDKKKHKKIKSVAYIIVPINGDRERIPSSWAIDPKDDSVFLPVLKHFNKKAKRNNIKDRIKSINKAYGSFFDPDANALTEIGRNDVIIQQFLQDNLDVYRALLLRPGFFAPEELETMGAAAEKVEAILKAENPHKPLSKLKVS